MLQRVLLAFFLVLVSSIGYAQLNEADSLEHIVKTIPADTSKVWHLNKLVSALRERDNKKALDYARQARDLALLLNYRPGLGQALEHLGWIHYRKGDFSKAFELSLEALAISESLKDTSATARCLNNVASINLEQEHHALAITNFKRAYTLSAAIGDSTSMSRSLNNIAFCFLGLKEMDSARVYATRGLHVAELFNKSYLVAFALRSLGDIDLSEKKFDNALLKFQRVLQIADPLGNLFLKVSTTHRIGKTYFAMHKNDLALDYLERNVTLARTQGFRSELERSLKLMSEIYASEDQIGKAYQLQNQYLVVHDSLYKQRSNEQIALMQVSFDSEIKETKIKLLTKEAQLKEEEINRQRMWMYFSIGSLTLMAILAFVLLYSNRLKNKTNDELELKNKAIQGQTQQLRNLNITKDKLFSIISHDLRSPLASLRGLLDIMDIDGLSAEDFLSSSKKLRKNLESVQEDLDNLLFWAQSQLNGLQSNPTRVKVRPIVEEKIHLFAENAQQKEVTIINEIDSALTIYADKNHISLAIRNLLANAIKFNKPGGLIMIREKSVGEFVEISVSDSGVGMSAADLGKLFNAETHFTNPGTHQEKGVGIGLLLTKEFIEKNGGSIWATSEPGKGSTFTFTVKQLLTTEASVVVNR